MPNGLVSKRSHAFSDTSLGYSFPASVATPTTSIAIRSLCNPSAVRTSTTTTSGVMNKSMVSARRSGLFFSIWSALSAYDLAACFCFPNISPFSTAFATSYAVRICICSPPSPTHMLSCSRSIHRRVWIPSCTSRYIDPITASMFSLYVIYQTSPTCTRSQHREKCAVLHHLLCASQRLQSAGCFSERRPEFCLRLQEGACTPAWEPSRPT